MNSIDPTTIVAVIAMLTGIGFIFNLFLKPVERRLDSLEEGQKNLETGVKTLEIGQQELKALLEKRI